MRRHARSSVTLLAGLLLAAGSLGGCGTTGEAAPGIIVVGKDDLRFHPHTATVPVGEAVTISFRNEGRLLHDLVTEGATRNTRLLNIAGGVQRGATFRADQPGVYAVVCIQPGHREAGMVGTILVQ